MRSRGWCFTVNNYTDEDQAYYTDIETLGCRYIVIGYEVGEEGTPHLQGYVYFDNPRFEKSVRKLFYPNHVEPQRARKNDDAIDYCTEFGDYYEVGNKPNQGVCNKEAIEAVMNDPFSNFHLYNMYRKSYQAYKNTHPEQHERKLYLVDVDDIYKVAKQCKEMGHTVSVGPSDYDGEDIVFCYDSICVTTWVNGLEYKKRIGYEIQVFNPKAVYLICHNMKDRVVYLKKYSEYIDNEQTNDD